MTNFTWANLQQSMHNYIRKKKIGRSKNNKVSHHYNNTDVILHGRRNFQDGLWDFPITYYVVKYNITSDNFLVPPLYNLRPQKYFSTKKTKL